MAPRARPRVAGVVGWPIRHSLSPLIHRIFAEREGADAVYLPLLVEPGRGSLMRALSGLRAAGFVGLNVTIPHKEDAFALADKRSAAAEAAGAANMLTFADDGLYADNSDIGGFKWALAQKLEGRRPGRALVLGAGGAARAVVLALKELEIGDCAIANRTRKKAEALAARFSARVADWPITPKLLAGVDILVNTTSLGMAGEPPLAIALTALSPDAIVADIVYRPLETGLLRDARARGLAVVDGIEMLMRQAAPGYEAWLGRKAVVDDELRAALVDALHAEAAK